MCCWTHLGALRCESCLATSASGSLLGDSSASQDSSTGVSGVSDSAGTSSSTSLQSGSDGSHLMAVWIVMGVVLSLIALACLALVCKLHRCRGESLSCMHAASSRRAISFVRRGTEWQSAFAWIGSESVLRCAF